MRKMKIHYLVTSLEGGGGTFAIPDIVRTLQGLGHDVTIIVCEPRDLGGAVRLKEAGLSYHLLSSRRRSLPVILAAYMLKIWSDRPDVIWSSFSWATRIGVWAGRITGIPVIGFKHSVSVRQGVYKVRNRPCLWVGDSQTVANYLRNEWHIPAQKVMAWPLYQSNPMMPEAQPWDGQSVLQLGSVGRLHDVKNYAGLIDAIAMFLDKHPDYKTRIKLTILGDGPEEKALQEKIARLGLEEVVLLAGFSPNVADFLKTLHVYIQTSRYEGMCLAVHEAMNAALPVIATPVGEIRDAVKNGKTGYTLTDELSSSFTTILEHIFENPSELSSYGHEARNYVLTQFSKQKYIEAAANILKRVSDKSST